MAGPGDHEAGSPVEAALEGLSEVIDGIVAQTCSRHYGELTEEPEFTAVLADRIETKLRDFRFGVLNIQVQAQTFPSHGRGTLEKKVGADIYISTVVKDGSKAISKGILAQAKWDYTADTDKKLDDQIDKMMERSPTSSYVWLYGPRGIEVVAAEAMSQNPRPPTSERQGTVGELIASSIRCNAGDPGIGRTVNGESVESLRSVMERIGAPAALGFIVAPRRR